MPTPTITVIGSLNTDLITRTPRLPLPGETLSATSFSTGCGGKGCNQAVACARLSSSRPSSPGSSSVHAPSAPPLINIRMVGAIGDDEFGDTLLQGLKRNGVDASGVSVVPGKRTGVAVIVVEEATGENRILLTPGANYCVTPASLQLPEEAWLSVSEEEEEEEEGNPALVVLQLEIPLSTVVHVVQRARRKGVPVLLNPAPAPVQEMPTDVYAGLEHLILNETEARALSSRLSSSSPSPLAPPPRDDHDDDDDAAFMDTVAARFHALGVTNVVLTLGARGVFFSTEGGASSGFVPAEKVDAVVDTTAAGDTFVGAYAVAVTEG
ncbi:MAG: hypothetical protein Q9173_007385, partial [Seirophora scorigena]